MTKKISWNRVLLFLSFLLSFLGLIFSIFYKFSSSTSLISPEMVRNTTLLIITTLAVALYSILIFKKKEILLPENKIAKILLFVFPILILLISFLTADFFDSFFGKYVYLQSGLTYFALFCLVLIVASYTKHFKRLTWGVLTLGNLLVTLPSILALILAKFEVFNLAGKLIFFIENWDIVATASAVIVILALIYFETIASTKAQRIFSLILILLHLVLISFILIPDIWYALAFSSLFILLFTKKSKKVKIFKTATFYVFLISFLFSLMFIFSSGPTSKLNQAYSTFANQVSGINYGFIKPNINLSLGLIKSELIKGRIFGSGPANFYKVWQQEKPQSVIDSSYWSVEFSSSFSAITTLAVTFGVIGLLFILAILILPAVKVFKGVKRIKFKNEDGEDLEFNQEELFYLLATATLFIFSVFLMIFFANINIATFVFALALALVLGTFYQWKRYEVSKPYNLITLIAFLLLLFGTILSINRIRSVYITNNALINYRNNGDIVQMEKDLTKSTNLVQRNDGGYRLLSQFYLFKAGVISNSTSTDKALLQEEVIASINNAVSFAEKAIKIDSQDFNNYLSSGSVYVYLMNLDKQNKDSNYQKAKELYTTAISLYPKNPSLYLTLANLEYSYNQNSTSTLEAIQQSLNTKSNYSEAYNLFSQLAAQNNNQELALEYATKAIQSDSQNVEAYLQYGILILNKGELTQDELNQAYTAFVSALTLDSNSVPAAYYLAITYTIAKEYDKAYELVDILSQILPDDESVQELRATLLNTEKVQSLLNASTTAEIVSTVSDSETATTTTED
ncbi:MAG TPA: tetratricopeptide repeat protein [Candidatus Paceibacterota bacterium]|nr:tetratricopeptide repeat protein [Candidatus Paceibacterota bacterium]